LKVTTLIDQPSQTKVALSDVLTEALPSEQSTARTTPGSVTGRSIRRTAEGQLVATDHTRTKSVLEWIVVLFAAGLTALIVRTTVLQMFYIPSESMSHTLETNDKVMVDKLSHRMTGVHHGDVVVFHRPSNLQNSKVKDLVKRVIGVEGDTVEAIGGQVYVNDVAINEPYLAKQNSTINLPKTTVGAHQLFMMGDNREHSSDSRVFGPISEDSVVGHARLVIARNGHLELHVL
jgi:signal peptidase I